MIFVPASGDPALAHINEAFVPEFEYKDMLYNCGALTFVPIQ